MTIHRLSTLKPTRLLDRAALLLIVPASALFGTVELLLVTLGAMIPQRRGGRTRSPSARPRTAVIIPAHDESGQIARSVSSARAAAARSGHTDVFVVADNCTDDTAAVAARAGARILVREDTTRRGKGWALAHAFDLLIEDYEVFVVVDADSVVSPNLTSAVARLVGEGADAVQVRYGVLNAAASTRTRLMRLALLAFNHLRPRGRERLGLSVGLLGNGFAVTRETLMAVPFDACSVVEDLEYHLRLLAAGRRVRFAEDAAVLADMPTGGSGIGTQRARWEGGRLRMIAEHAPRLLGRVFRGHLRFVEPLLELLLLPLAWHVLALVLLALLPFDLVRAGAVAGLAVVALHVLLAIRIGGTRGDLLTLAAAPFHIVAKLAVLPAILKAARPESSWVRTRRENPSEVLP